MAVIDAGPRSTFTGTIRVRLRAPARRRNLELFLLVGALILSGGALVLVELGALGRVGGTLLVLEGGLAILVLLGHIAARVFAPDADPFVFPVGVLLNGIGIAEITRIDIEKGLNGWGAAGVRQIVWTAIALIVAFAVLVLIRNHRVLQRYRYIAMFSAIVLLLLPALPGIGRTISGARVWIAIGPFSFQPGELAKIALAIFFAGYLVTARDSLSLVGRTFLGMRFPRVRDLGPIV
ncbi:MAG: FtsW/RodA/SpoVE family cell cycle protein, partial [Actinomycetota bacterium]|nr:FtsW/RodA/SpoVE family cell cycle protein [Actinomycetota bacterium]